MTHHKKEETTHMAWVNGKRNEVSIKELTHSLHPKPIDSNKLLDFKGVFNNQRAAIGLLFFYETFSFSNG
ncbi:hypothetical protein BACPU_01870 [Bacillus pumilus]|nr:hypothetical protein BACPU_01870 [Bacillus pumilus]